MMSLIWSVLIVIVVKMVYPIATHLLNQDKSIKKNVVNGLKVMLITFVGDMLIVGLAFGIYGTFSSSFQENVMKMLLGWCVIQMCTVYIVMYFKKRQSMKDMTMICISSILFPLLQLFIIPFITAEAVSGDWVLPVTILLGVCADINLLYVVYTMTSIEMLKKNIEVQEKELLLMADVQSEAQQDEERLLRLKNEYQTELNRIYKVYCDDAGTELCNEYIDELERKIKSTKNSKCYNVIVNTILMEKEEQCITKGISFQCDVQLGENTGISNLHLCSIFNNLLNNAIEACEQLTIQEKYINIKCFSKGNYLNVVVKNSADDNKRKVRSKGHGYGLKILDDIAGKYKGKFRYEYKKGEFKASISVLMTVNAGDDSVGNAG